MKYPLGVFLLLISHWVVSQDFLSWQLNDRYFSVLAGAGMSSYRGELKHNKSIQNEFSNFSLGLEARLLSKVSARFEITQYSIRGSDDFASDSSYARQRNLKFTSQNWEASLMGVFFLKKYRGDYFKRWAMDPYIFGGVGFTYFNPTTQLGNQSYELAPLRTEGLDYSQLAVIFPLGAGLKFKLNSFTNFNLEASYRFTLTDYLDDVSTTYAASYPNTTVELIANRKDEIPVVNQEAYDQLIAGGPRGNPTNNDRYLFLSFKFELFLPPDLFQREGGFFSKSRVR